MTPVSPASTRRDDDGSHDGQPANSPVSTLVSPVSQHGHHDREQHRDDNLPEVYVESSPQALLHESKQDARGHYAPDYANEKEALGDESDTHKLPVYSVPQDLNKLGPEAPGDFPPGAMADAERNPEPAAAPPKDERIMGLKRRTFFIVLVIVLIVVAAAVGGGVGGAVASSSNSDNDAGGATSTSDSPPSS